MLNHRTTDFQLVLISSINEPFNLVFRPKYLLLLENFNLLVTRVFHQHRILYLILKFHC